MRFSRTLSTLFLVLLCLVGAGLAWAFFATKNSPLEVLNILNPRNAPIANVTETQPTDIGPVVIGVPEQWKTGRFATPRAVNLPAGFSISIFASGFEKARFMALDDRGTLYLTDSRAGRVYALPDDNADGVADESVVFAERLNFPHGIAFHGGSFYVAETDKVQRHMDVDGDRIADDHVVVVRGLPSGGSHVTRTIGFDAENRLYVSVGSSCNACRDDERRAAILRFNEDGSGETLFAAGLRNSVGFVAHPDTGEIWATENGRDLLGDDIPPEEVNIVREGKHYGWPFCYGDRVVDPAFGTAEFCATTEAPALTMQAHSAPLGLRFYTGEQFPAAFNGDLFVAFHGSWNRREPTGYKVVVADLDDPASTITDFANGWLVDGEAWGRPVDLLVAPDGALFLSDDDANVVYRITYTEPL